MICMPAAHVQDARIPFEAPAGGRHAPAMRWLLLIWRSWAAARTRAELRGLSDRALRDIGLERGQIDALFR
jgi:uncharacterized protein YjiS (DUF1127 family)